MENNSRQSAPAAGYPYHQLDQQQQQQSAPTAGYPYQQLDEQQRQSAPTAGYPYHQLDQQQQQQSAPTAGYPYHQLDQQQQQRLEMFWTFQRQEIGLVNNFKNHQLPLARIKKIMKAEENVQKISTEVPILFAKACELFIQELTTRSWYHAEEKRRRMLQNDDITAAIIQNDIFHNDEINEEAGGSGPVGMVGSTTSDIPYFYPQPDPYGLMMGRSRVSPSVYIQSRPPPLQVSQSSWQAAEDNSYASGGNCGHGNLHGQS